MLLTFLFSLFVTTVVSQSTPAVVCVPGQCLQGYSNVSIGASLSDGSNTTLRLLPGEYTTNTNPKLLHGLLTSSSSTLARSPGFSSANLSPLPLNLKLESGLALYSGANYSGTASHTGLPESPINSSTSISANSLAISENVWIAVSSGNNAQRVVLWESVPDVTELSLSSSLNLLDIQSSACVPACSSNGMCNASGQCVCPPNFSGASCEACAAGHFGPTCQPCPEGCSDCDEGMSGSGRCLSVSAGANGPETCNCVNGECNSDGSCTCNQGWIDGSESKCSSCATGFFLSSTGSCTACQLGCIECDDTTAVCTSCKPGFRQNPNDRTKCEPDPQTLSTGAPCPQNTFPRVDFCDNCSSECDSCTGPNASDCLTCARGLFMANGRCVSTDSNGVCAGTDGLVADNLKRVCDVCPSKCSSCRIPNFAPGSSIDEVRCTQCTPGSVLHNGRCLDTCPEGTFVNPQDNLSCIPCSSDCATCVGSSNFCTSCPGNLFAFDGQCIQSCPSDTFTTSTSTTPPRNACTKCHPDCETCSGSSFNQCTTCPSSRPVLSAPSGSTSGRCLPTCNKNQYFDQTARECKTCDGSCGSCTGPGPSSCLSCQSPSQVIRNGQCVEANCLNGSSVVPGLGICLSALVVVPSTTDETLPPLPTITGISEPAPKQAKLKLQWWQILLMALGCAFIFVAFLWCFRRRMRKQRKQRTQMFAKGKGLARRRWDWGAGWRRLWTRKPRDNVQETELPIAYNHQDVALRAMKEQEESVKMSNLKPRSKASKNTLKDNKFLGVPRANDQRRTRDDDFDSYIDAYDYSRRSMALSVKSHTPSTLPDLDGFYPSRKGKVDDRDRLRRQAAQERERARNLDHDSIYSEVTGQARNTPEPRMPVKSDLRPIVTGYSDSSSSRQPKPVEKKTSDETLSSIVISPKHQREGLLVDLDAEWEREYPLKPTNANNTNINPLLHQLPRVTPPPLLPPIQPQPTFTSFQTTMTEAQAYAMAVKPSLDGQPQNLSQAGYTLAWVPTQMTGSTGGMGIVQPNLPIVTPNMTGSTSSTTLGSGGGGAGGYWLHPSTSSRANLTGVQHTPTGSSGDSKNPFRQGPVPF